MRSSLILLLPLLSGILGVNTPNTLSAQAPPLVYDVEQTLVDAPDLKLPEYVDLPISRPLPDPFAWSDGRGRSIAFEDWARRRVEIRKEIEHFGIGTKPPRPDNITAEFTEGVLTVHVQENGETLSLTAQVKLPSAGGGPFPAVIGIGRGTGSLSAEIFEDRDIATIAFNFGQVMSHTQTRGNEPINRLYPELVHIGAYSAWSWGISRIIDGLELVEAELPIDRSRLGVTGCSFAGKMALFAGAFDERIALTIAQESGGGGAAAWRVSETLGNVETLGNTSGAWFLEDMFRFSNSVEKLPYDHHELMAMVAPRALLVLGNPDYEWLADESGYVSCRAAHEVWKTFNISDRFGFSIVGGHPHCRLPENQRPEVEAFVDKFLLGKAGVNTSVTKHPFPNVEYEFWYDGWSKGVSTFPVPDSSDVETHFIEAEKCEIGNDWKVEHDPNASGGEYLTVKAGLNSPQAIPAASSSEISASFSIESDAKFYAFARVNCPSADDDSFWLQFGGQEFEAANGLRTSGWEWVKLTAQRLSSGEHRIRLKYREDGALLDQICITTYPFGPDGLDEIEKNQSIRSLKSAVGDRFKIGVGVSHNVLNDLADVELIEKHFQILTPENCMKPQGIHPAEDQWNYEATDQFAQFARDHELEMVGHCLVWAKDDRTDAWMMKEGEDAVSKETLLKRIESHVATVVQRYADVVTMWDVVNEALGDSDGEMLRESIYSKTTDIDFIVTAFKTARLHDPDALLIYNDYNGHKPDKRAKLLALLTRLKEAGAPIDAYGMQGHFELGDDSLEELQTTFDELRKLGLQVVVSELDIDVVTRGRWWADDGKYRDELSSFDPYADGLPDEIEEQVNEQYVQLFKLFDKNSDIIARVSFWNLHDGQSWLNYFPWRRVNYPLLFDRHRQTKSSFDAVVETLTNDDS